MFQSYTLGTRSADGGRREVIVLEAGNPEVTSGASCWAAVFLGAKPVCPVPMYIAKRQGTSAPERFASEGHRLKQQSLESRPALGLVWVYSLHLQDLPPKLNKRSPVLHYSQNSGRAGPR